METLRYTLVQRLLHWIIVLLVLGLLVIGTILANVGYDKLVELVGSDITNLLYTYHKTFGVLVLALMLLRLILRQVFRPPAYQPELNRVEHALGLLTHTLFYTALIAIPIFGWLGTAAGGFPVQFFDWTLPGLIGRNDELSGAFFQLHALISWILIGLILLHTAAALYHWRVKRDGVMQRMSLM